MLRRPLLLGPTLSLALQLLRVRRLRCVALEFQEGRVLLPCDGHLGDGLLFLRYPRHAVSLYLLRSIQVVAIFVIN